MIDIPANATIEQLRRALDSRRISAQQLVQYYLNRIERFDRRGSHLNALIRVNSCALEQARKLDAERRSGRTAGMLYGIPFIAKDNYDTVCLPTSGGSAVLKDSLPAANAHVVQRLLDAGAILIGKSNMSELGASCGRLGYSSAGGLTLNPYNTMRDVSGSSSGSASALAADFAAFALGTDTTGSIRGPAGAAGLVGLRPTPGLIGRGGVMPLSLTFDTTGALARNVPDLAIILDAIAGPDPRDCVTLQRPTLHQAYRDSLDQDLFDARLGVIGNFRGDDAEVDRAEDAALTRLKALGAILVPIALPQDFETLGYSVLERVGRAEFKREFERYLRTLAPTQPQTLAELIERMQAPAISDSKTPVNPARLAALRDANDSGLVDSAEYIDIVARMIPTLRRRLQEVMDANGLQAFVFATMSRPAAPRFDIAPAGAAGDAYNRGDSNRTDSNRTDSNRAGYIASVVGFPEITVPSDRTSENLPVGYSFMGPAHSERRLLSFAHAFQVATPSLPPPELS